MRPRLSAFVFILGLVCLEAAPTPVAGTRVALEPPTGFVKAEQFPGFIQKATQASILVSEIPGPIAEVTKGFTAAGLATRKMKLVKKESVPLATGEGLLLSVTQEAQGTRFAKWMLAFGDATRSTLIVATYPENSDASLGASLRQSLLGVTLPDNLSAPSEGLTFAVDERAPLRITQRLGNSVILSTGGKSPNAPLLVVTASITEDVQIANRRAHAKQRLRQTEHLERIDLLAENLVEIDGLPGVTLLAHGRDRKTGARIFLLQTTLYNDEGYFIAQGLAPADQRATYEPVFDAIVASFRRKR